MREHYRLADGKEAAAWIMLSAIRVANNRGYAMDGITANYVLENGKHNAELLDIAEVGILTAIKAEFPHIYAMFDFSDLSIQE